MQLVLAVCMQHELMRTLEKLANPLHLHRASEAHALRVVLVSYDAQSMGTLITRLSVELDAADELQPTGGRTAVAVCWASSCVPEGAPTGGRTAAAVCWAANCVPDGGIRVSGAGMGS